MCVRVETMSVKITTAEKANEKYQTRVYPVGDLVIPIPIVSVAGGGDTVAALAHAGVKRLAGSALALRVDRRAPAGRQQNIPTGSCAGHGCCRANLLW